MIMLLMIILLIYLLYFIESEDDQSISSIKKPGRKPLADEELSEVSLLFFYFFL